jgi:TnpA family transposase
MHPPRAHEAAFTGRAHDKHTAAFAFCRLLGFQLMPRLKAIHVQKLSRPDVGQPDAYPNLQAILTRPIDWELVRQQYDQMVKYVTAVRLGTAETESILRRFVRSNIQHPTYKAFPETRQGGQGRLPVSIPSQRSAPP